MRRRLHNNLVTAVRDWASRRFHPYGTQILKKSQFIVTQSLVH